MTSDCSSTNRIRLINRALWILVGVGTFFWIGYEDRSTTIPILLGGTLALTLGLHFGQRILTAGSTGTTPFGVYLFLGLIAGLTAMPIAAMSMLVKVSLHGHVPPDFSTAEVLAVLSRTPAWAGAGALAGSAASLWRHIAGE